MRFLLAKLFLVVAVLAPLPAAGVSDAALHDQVTATRDKVLVKALEETNRKE